MGNDRMAPSTSQRSLASWLLLGGLLVVFAGERLIGAGSGRWLTAIGAALVVASTAMRAVRAMRAGAERAQAERLFAIFAGLSVIALLFYALQSDLVLAFAAAPLDKTWPRLSGILSVLWPVLIVASVLPTISSRPPGARPRARPASRLSASATRR